MGRFKWVVGRRWDCRWGEGREGEMETMTGLPTLTHARMLKAKGFSKRIRFYHHAMLKRRTE